MPEQQGDPVVKDVEVDIDAEMEDPQEAPEARNPIDTTSGAPDPETAQSEAQPATTTSGLQQQNRKDVTLREFLSKMDDYAPIVRARHPAPRSHHFSEVHMLIFSRFFHRSLTP
jgi:hypothetical protein